MAGGAWLRLSWKTRVRVQRKTKSRAHVGLGRDCLMEEGLPRGLGWEMAQRPSLQLSWKIAPRVGLWTERKGYACSWRGAGKGLPRDLGWETPFAGKWLGGALPYGPAGKRGFGLRSRKPGVIAGVTLERCCQR